MSTGEAPEVCCTCGRALLGRRYPCTRCGGHFCAERTVDLGTRAAEVCGFRRDNTTEADVVTRVDYRCRNCRTVLWTIFGADWQDLRGLALLGVGFLIATTVFWLLVVAAVARLSRAY